MLNVTMLPYVVEAGLELHPLEDRHARAVFALVNENRVHLRQWQNWPDRIRTLNDMRSLIYKSEQKKRANNGFDALIVYHGQIVGKIGLVYVDWIEQRTEIGYWLAESHQGMGLITKACRVLVAYALMEMQLRTVNIRCAGGNTRSAAIPQRLGFIYAGAALHKIWLHGQMQDEVMFTMTHEAWKQQMIYHITTREAWQVAQLSGTYRAPSLAEQGFIHLSSRDQIIKVANAVYAGQPGLVLLCIAPDLLDAAALKYELADTTIPVGHDEGELFPHLYSPLPCNAVLRVVDFPPGKDGGFTLPDALG